MCDLESDLRVLTQLQPSDLLMHTSFLSDSTDFPLSQCRFDANVQPEIDFSSTQLQSSCSSTNVILNYMNTELASLPRDSFVSNLVDKCKLLNYDIESIRYELFDIAKRRSDFPYTYASLKKRLIPRKASGESVESKLGNDCYLLCLATSGEFHDDIKTVLNIRSHCMSSRKQSVFDDENTSDFFVANLSLKDSLVRMERDLNSLKGDHKQEIDYLTKTVTILTKENKQLLDINTKNQDRFRNFQNQLTSIRNTSEESTRLLSEFKSTSDERLTKCSSNTENINNMKEYASNLEKKIDDGLKELLKVKGDVGKVKKDVAIISKDFKELQITAKSESVRINQLSDTRVLGVQSLKAKTDLLNDKLKEINDSISTTQENSASFSRSITDIRKRLSKTEKDIGSLDKSRKSYADILKAESSISPEKCDNQLELQKSSHDTALAIHTMDADISFCNGSNPPDISKKSHQHRESTHTEELPVSSNIESKRQIPVYFPRSTCHPTTSDCFNGFVKKGSRRVKRFYIGGIDKRSTEASMREFLSVKNICVTHLRYFNKHDRRTASAQLNIDAEDEHSIRDRSFWPPGVFMKNWLPWSVFLSEKGVQQDSPTQSCH